MSNRKKPYFGPRFVMLGYIGTKSHKYGQFRLSDVTFYYTETGLFGPRQLIFGI